MEEIKEAIDRLVCKGEPVPTVFEVETAMAFLYFKKQKCDLVVLETGLGGETDATNVIKNTVCAVFATISVDHLILRKKAESLNCIYTEAEPEQMSIEKEDYKGLTFSYKKYAHMQNHIAGECQRENLSVALEVIESLRKLGYQIEKGTVLMQRDGRDVLLVCLKIRL